MENKLEEQYVLLRIARGDFDQAMRSLKRLKCCRNPDTISALIRDAMIAYSRPFTENRGKYKKKGLKLKINIIPKQQREFHSNILDIRNKIIAHTDIDYRDPSLVKGETKIGPLYLISFKGFYFQNLVKMIGPLKDLVLAVSNNAAAKIKEIEKNHF